MLMAYTIEDNTPLLGYISWSGCHIVYNGIDYSIDDGSTNMKYVWWDYDYPTVFQTSDVISDLTDDDAMVFFNKNGTHLTVPTATIIEGGLIVPESILTDALAANSITSSKILAGAISAQHIAAGAVGAEAIAAGVIVSDHICADGITANKITSGQIATNLVQIRGNSNFYWDGNYFYMVNPNNLNEQIRLSKEGIRFTKDGGQSWNVAIDFDGLIIGPNAQFEAGQLLTWEPYIGKTWQEVINSVNA